MLDFQVHLIVYLYVLTEQRKVDPGPTANILVRGFTPGFSGTQGLRDLSAENDSGGDSHGNCDPVKGQVDQDVEAMDIRLHATRLRLHCIEDNSFGALDLPILAIYLSCNQTTQRTQVLALRRCSLFLVIVSPYHRDRLLFCSVHWKIPTERSLMSTLWLFLMLNRFISLQRRNSLYMKRFGPCRYSLKGPNSLTQHTLALPISLLKACWNIGNAGMQ